MRILANHTPWLFCFLLVACVAPKYTPPDLGQIRSPAELAMKTQEAYRQGKVQSEKSEKLRFAQAGIQYADKCLALAPRTPECLFYRVLNTGLFIQNHIPNYQNGLRRMVADCEKLNEIQPGFENAGGYRVLGTIYAKAPSFTVNPKNVSQDWDKSVENLKEAVKLAPNYALNRLFLARSLEAVGEKAAAKNELLEFDRLAAANLDSEYPEWKQDRNKLAQKLLGEKSNEQSANANH